MKVSLATSKIKSIKKSYLFSCISVLSIIYILISFIILMLVLPSYTNVGWKGFFLKHFNFLYPDKNLNQVLMNVIEILIGIILLVGISFIIIRKFNFSYKKDFMNVLCNELELNEIYKEKKRLSEDASGLEFISKSLKIDKKEKDFLFSFKSMFPLNFYQYHSSSRKKKDNSLLIKCPNDKKFGGYIQMRFDKEFTIDTYQEKGIFQFSFIEPRKYPYDVYVNSSLGKRTYAFIDDKVLNTLIQLKRFTCKNIVVTLTDDLYYVWIPGWELMLTDHLFAHLDYDAIDKKTSLFTELIDEITDLYIYILSKEEIWVEKW